jgi:hypothetical protein
MEALLNVFFQVDVFGLAHLPDFAFFTYENGERGGSELEVVKCAAQRVRYVVVLQVEPVFLLRYEILSFFWVIVHGETTDSDVFLPLVLLKHQLHLVKCRFAWRVPPIPKDQKQNLAFCSFQGLVLSASKSLDMRNSSEQRIKSVVAVDIDLDRLKIAEQFCQVCFQIFGLLLLQGRCFSVDLQQTSGELFSLLQLVNYFCVFDGLVHPFFCVVLCIEAVNLLD